MFSSETRCEGEPPGSFFSVRPPRHGQVHLVGPGGFWRTRAGLEVDFVVYGPELFWAIKVKRTARIGKKDLAGLQAFGADYPEAERWLLSFSPEPLGIDGIRCEPLELWLRQLQVEPPG